MPLTFLTAPALVASMIASAKPRSAIACRLRLIGLQVAVTESAVPSSRNPTIPSPPGMDTMMATGASGLTYRNRCESPAKGTSTTVVVTTAITSVVMNAESSNPRPAHRPNPDSMAPPRLRRCNESGLPEFRQLAPAGQACATHSNVART